MSQAVMASKFTIQKRWIKPKLGDFSNYQVRDLAFGPDGRLWGVQWDGKDITDSQYGHTQIVSFPMTGREIGRAQFEYSLSGVIDSIAFGQTGSELAGLLIAGSQTDNVVTQGSAVSHSANLWMINLTTRELVSVAQGGTRAEALVTTQDGRILVAQTGFVDEVAPIKAPKVVTSSIADGALLPLPVNQITVSFDQSMWTGSNGQDSQDPSSVLNPNNYRLVSVSSGSSQVINPTQVTWDEGSKSVILTLGNLNSDQWRLEVASNVVSRAKVRLDGVYVVGFTTVSDLTNQLKIDFSNTRADRLTGSISYDVNITNLGVDNLKGPLMLLIDPGQYFSGSIDGNALSGAQQGLWVIDASAALKQSGGKLAQGQTLKNITVTVVSPQDLSTSQAGGTLIKATLSHQVYGLPYANLPPTMAAMTTTTVVDSAGVSQTVSDISTSSELNAAQINQAWQANLVATDSDGQAFSWVLVDAPLGMTLSQSDQISTTSTGDYQNIATLHWTPTAQDLADTSILVKVIDSRGGVALKRFNISVTGGNHAVVITQPRNVRLGENTTLTLPIGVSDADGDVITVSFNNLPDGAQYDAATRTLTWTPSYDQAGQYNNIEIIASDGKTISKQVFNVEVSQGYAKPQLPAMPTQNLREGEAFGMQLPGFMPGGLVQADGTTVSLEYYINVLPAGMTLDRQTGWLSWTPGFTQHGKTELPIRLIATYQPADGSRPVTTVASQTLVLDVANANGVPVFMDNQPWQIMEGQPLRISTFAMDPDNPSFTPKVRFAEGKPAVSEDGTDVPATVRYEIKGLPEGASFDAETLQISWTPTYQQAGTYYVEVTATDDGDGTGVPAVAKMIVPIQVNNANRAPVFGKLDSVVVKRGEAVDIPVSVIDLDGNDINLALSGLPRFASFTQTSVENTTKGRVISGVIHLAPSAGDRGSYTIGLTATDDGDGDSNAAQQTSTAFVVTVQSETEAPVIAMPRQLIAVAGQKLSIPVNVSDLDQDALSYVLQGLPAGAKLVQGVRYGEATIEWTPTTAQIGQYNATLIVKDSGLPAANSGYATPENPVVNVTSVDFSIQVKASNTVPGVLSISANGQLVEDTNLAAPLTIAAKEGEALNLQVIARDGDGDSLYWRATGLPSGMTLDSTSQSNGQSTLSLNWLPGSFAAQLDNGLGKGSYLVTLTTSDGMASYERQVRIDVANTNQAPVLLPMPMQLVYEGQTLGFSVMAQDADGDALRYSLVYDDTTPKDVQFNPTTGYFEWTPTVNTVDNATAKDKTYQFTFAATDGQARVLRTVQVRVLDVNRAPTISASNHAVVVGDTLSLPIVKGTSQPTKAGIYLQDADGQRQTQGLTVSFSHLPEGAVYDASRGVLDWTPDPVKSGIIK
ncbi:putative Ig domain-containing protein [Faucicola mancuniensis]|uniref:putative Ig domain-containing protein n=1 Tax=Faucicola mancuniensis TaxID=1309795 RepID=UPI003977D7AA